MVTDHKGKGTAGMTVPDCAQIVPVKVKYNQTFPNETKNSLEKGRWINRLKSQVFLPLVPMVLKSLGAEPRAGSIPALGTN